MNTCIWEQEGTIACQLWNQGRVDFPIYDMHGHMGPHPAVFFKHCEADDMVKHLKRAGIKHLAFSHHLALDAGMRNADVYDICRQYPDTLRMYVAINPNFPEQIQEDLALYDQWTPYAIGLKFLPDYHGHPVNGPKYEYALKFADERGIPVLCHTWGSSKMDNGTIMLDAAQKYPHAKFFMGHSIFGDWDMAERCVKESNNNVWLELTAIPGERGIIKKLCQKVGSERILFGTDLPWFDEFQALGGIASSGISDEEIKNILWHNPENILGNDW